MPNPFLVIDKNKIKKKTRNELLNQFQLENRTIKPIVRTIPSSRPDPKQKVQSTTIERAGQKPVDRIPVNGQGQKRVVETISSGISKQEPIVRTNSIQ